MERRIQARTPSLRERRGAGLGRLDSQRAKLKKKELAAMFHPAVSTWLERRFRAPTPVQEQAWPAIEQGHDALLMAPRAFGAP